MNHLLYQLWGEGKELTALQVSSRTIAMFFIAIVLLRLGGVRIFSRKSAFDEIIAIMLGAVLSRGVTGASPFGNVVVSGILMIAIYRIIGWLCTKSKKFERLIKGDPSVLYKDGEYKKGQMERSMISEEDIQESLRLEIQETDLGDIKEVRLETNGRLSFTKS